MMKLIIELLISCSFSLNVFSQNAGKFCKAVQKENFKKVERLFKKQVKQRKKGKVFYNGPGSGYQVTHQYTLDTLTLWLKDLSCVEDVFWDKCQSKIMIYPGTSVIGAKFKTNKGIVEKCFLIQEGTTGNIKVFGWKPHIFKARNILVYKKMYNCDGFIEKQRKNCGDR